MYLSMTICFKISILGKTGDFCRAWDMRKIVPGVTSSYATSVFKLYLSIAKGRREREKKKSMLHRPVGKFFVSGEFGPGKEPSSGQADCQIVPREKQPGQFEELLPTGVFTAPECGPGK